MLNIVVKVSKIDLYGYNGRDHHPDVEHEGRFVRVYNMDTVPPDEGEEEGYQVFHGVVLDANGDEIPGELVELIDHELECADGLPVLYAQNPIESSHMVRM